MASIPGNWTFFFSWGCGTAYSSIPVNFSPAGTWTAPGFNGRWALTDGMLLFNFNGLPTVYGGNTAGNAMAGTSTTFGGNGCWYAKKAGVTPLAASKGGSFAGGAQGGTKGATKKSAKKRASSKKR